LGSLRLNCSIRDNEASPGWDGAPESSRCCGCSAGFQPAVSPTFQSADRATARRLRLLREHSVGGASQVGKPAIRQTGKSALRRRARAAVAVAQVFLPAVSPTFQSADRATARRLRLLRERSVGGASQVGKPAIRPTGKSALRRKVRARYGCSAGFLTCRIADFPVGRPCDRQTLPPSPGAFGWRSFAGWKTCDTADWKVCATLRRTDLQRSA
jgi:hypothetical protein